MIMEEGPLIFRKMVEINRKVKVLPKMQKNQQQGFMFRGIDDVYNELHDLFAEAGVLPIPVVTDRVVSERVTKNGTIQYCTSETIDYHFYAEDGSSVTATVVGEACDTGDKGTTKAMSIAYKYALLQIFLIPTEERKDPDFNTPEESVPKGILLNNAIKAMEAVTSREQLNKVWSSYPSLQKNEKFLEAVKAAGAKYPKTTNQ